MNKLEKTTKLLEAKEAYLHELESMEKKEINALNQKLENISMRVNEECSNLIQMVDDSIDSLNEAYSKLSNNADIDTTKAEQKASAATQKVKAWNPIEEAKPEVDAMLTKIEGIRRLIKLKMTEIDTLRAALRLQKLREEITQKMSKNGKTDE